MIRMALLFLVHPLRLRRHNSCYLARLIERKHMSEAAGMSGTSLGQSSRFSAVRWLLFAPTSIAAFLLVMLFFVLIRDFAGMARPIKGDGFVVLLANALAACISSAVAMAVSPAHRTKVAILWIALIFLTACYGNFINSAILVPLAEAIRNITVITLGATLGCVAAKGKLTRIRTKSLTEPPSR